MKINELRLVAFGPFTDKILDFSGNGYGFHLVFCTNEAGKSTALRALQALLYGFGHIVQDAWLHESNKLAVGGTLALDNGGSLNLTRYKRRKNDLINEAAGQPFHQADLDTINQHRARMGRPPLDLAAGWTPKEISEMASNIRARGTEYNPSQDRLKRKLMR